LADDEIPPIDLDTPDDNVRFIQPRPFKVVRQPRSAVVAAILAGATPDQAATRTGWSAQRIRDDLAPGRPLAIEVAAEREQVIERIANAITSGALIGVRTLIEVASSHTVTPTARVNAARTLVEMAIGKRVESATSVVAVVDWSDQLRAKLTKVAERMATIDVDLTETDVEFARRGLPRTAGNGDPGS
jgi:hypothetical protein